MSRREQTVAFISHGDSVRREAYERAMAILNNRPGISQDADIATVRAYDGPVVAGDVNSLPSRRRLARR